MVRTPRIAKNSLLLFFSQGYAALTALLYIPLLTRYLGQEGYGRYNYAYAFVGIFQVIASLGLHQILVREVARAKDQAGIFLGNALAIKILLSAITVAIITLAAILRGPQPEDLLLMGLAATEMLIRIYGNANLSIFRAYERMEYELIIDFIDGTVALAGVVLVVYLNLGLVWVFFAFLSAAVARTLTSFAINLVRFVSPRFEMKSGLWRNLLQESTPIGVSMGMQRAYERQGTVILEGMRGSAEVGLLGGPLRIYRLVDIVAQSVVGALFPVFSALAVSSRETLLEAYKSALKLLVLLSIPITFLLFIFADGITSFLMGPAFLASADLLRLLAPAILFSFAGFLFSYLLRAIDRQNSDTGNWALALTLNLGLSYWLISQQGFMGAGLALFISEGVFALVGFLLVSWYLPAIPLLETLLKPLLAGLVAGFVLFALQSISPLVAILASGLIYILAIFGLRILNPREKAVLNGLAFYFAARLGLRKS